MPSFEDILLKISRASDVDADQLGVFGKQAAKRLLEDGVHPNETIQKIAQAEGLNAHEIRRVCEFANLATYDHHMKEAGAGDKTFEHPVADFRDITVGEQEKSAMPRIFSTEYDAVPDADLCGDDLDVFEAFGVEPPTEKVASLNRANMLIEKLELLRQNMQDKLAMNMEQLKESGEKFFHQVKQQVMSNGGDFDKVHEAVHKKVEGKPHADRVMQLMDYSKRRMYDMGVLQSHARTGDTPTGTDSVSEKKAEPVQRDLITEVFESPCVPVTVLNGRHPMFAVIDTLVKQFDERDDTSHNLIILDDKIRYTKHRVYGKQPL